MSRKKIRINVVKTLRTTYELNQAIYNSIEKQMFSKQAKVHLVMCKNEVYFDSGFTRKGGFPVSSLPKYVGLLVTSLSSAYNGFLSLCR